MADDKQLRRLYDYTKFHIGIYLGAASGLVALISTASRDGTSGSYIASLVGCPKSLAVSLVLMFLAGVAGAVVATSTIESKTYAGFVGTKQGAYGFRPFLGKTWVTIEHASFWLSLGALAFGVLSAQAVRNWIF